MINFGVDSFFFPFFLMNSVGSKGRKTEVASKLPAGIKYQPILYRQINITKGLEGGRRMGKQDPHTKKSYPFDHYLLATRFLFDDTNIGPVMVKPLLFFQCIFGVLCTFSPLLGCAHSPLFLLIPSDGPDRLI